MAGPVVVSIIGDTRDLVRKLGDGESRLGRFGRAAGTVGKVAGAGLAAGAVAVGAFAVSAVKSASNAEQSIGATETVFGRFADTVVKRSGEASTAYGLSANEYRESANLIGSLFKNQGVAADQLAGKTDKMVGLGSDLAATFGGTTSEAVGALGSAFKGEFDPLERFGISIKQSTINAELAARGQDKLTGAALTAAKQQATTDLIMRQAGDSVGAFGREADTLAGQQQRMGAQWEDLKAKGGSLLLPVLTSLGQVVNERLFPALERMGPPIVRFGQEVGSRLAPLLPKVQTAARFLADAWARLSGFVVASLPSVIRFGQEIGAKLAPVVEALVTVFRDRLLPTFIRVAPIVGQIAGVIARVVGTGLKLGATILGAVLPPLIRFAGFLIARVVPAALKVVLVIARVVGALVGFVAGLVRAVGATVQFAAKVVSAFLAIPGKVTGAVSLLVSKGRDLIAGVVTGIRNKAGDMASAVTSAISGLGSKVRGAASELWGTGRDIISGLISGIRDAAGGLVTAIRTYVINAIPAPIRKALHINSPSRVMRAIGVNVVEGLIVGIEEKRSDVRRIMEALSSDLVVTGSSADLGGVTVTPVASSVTAGAGGVTIAVSLEVPVGATGADVGRELVDYLEDYFAAGGRKPW